MSTTYDYAPLEYFSAGQAAYYAIPPRTFLGQEIKFGKDANGQTVFQYIDPDKPWMSQAYQKKSNGSYQLDSNGNLIPIYNADGTPKMVQDTLSDGTPLTNKVWMDKVEHFSISPDGRSLVSNLGPNQRSVDGYTSGSKWTLSGSGSNENITFNGANDFVSGTYSSPTYGVANVPTDNVDKYTLSDNYQKYLNSFSSLAKGVQQRITSKTVTDEGILGDIKNTIGQLGPLAPIALAVAFPGVGAAIGSALGVTGAAASVIGNTLINTVLNGGDPGKALASSLTSLTGAEIGGVAGDIAKGGDLGNLLQSNPQYLSNLANSVTQAAIKGQDVSSALEGSLISSGVSDVTSKIDGFSALPATVQNSINAVVASELAGKSPTNALINQAVLLGQQMAKEATQPVVTQQENVTPEPAIQTPQSTNLVDIANVGNETSQQNQNAGTALSSMAANQLLDATQSDTSQTTPIQSAVTDQTYNAYPENANVIIPDGGQTQSPETQQVADNVVANANLQDNQPNAADQGNSMASDILDSLSTDTGTTDNTDASNFDLNAATSDLQNVYGGDLSTSDIAAALGGDTTGTSSGGTTLASFLKSIMPTTALGQAALASGAGGVLQGLIGANASSKAAQIQADAAKAALAQQQSMFNTLNQQQAPYRGAGYGALNQIQGMLPGQYTKYDAQGNPIGTATGSGYLTQQFTPELFQQGIDPGYAWRLQQGQMAAQRQGNVGGGGLGGNVQKGLQDYTQGQASQEYQNAFNRFQTQRSNIYNTLAGIAGIGQTGQGQANQLGTNLANAQANLGVGSAAAQAAGQVGQAGAYGGALNSINQALMLGQLPDIAAAMKG